MAQQDKFKTKADRSFEAKLADLTARDRRPLDVAAVEGLFSRYGAYLELVEPAPAAPPAGDPGLEGQELADA